MTARITVVIADDHPVLRTGLRSLIDAQPDMEVTGEVASAPELMRVATQLRPDVVLLDISMPGPGFRQTIEDLVRTFRDIRVLVLTMHDDSAYVRSALQAGASGYVVKKAADSELIAAIRAVKAGRVFVDLMRPEEEAPAALGASEADSARGLSPREQQVLQLLAKGFTNQEIAEQIFLSIKTVETYRMRLYSKLGLQSRAELYRFAVAAGLLDERAEDAGSP